MPDLHGLGVGGFESRPELQEMVGRTESLKARKGWGAGLGVRWRMLGVWW